MADEEAQYVSSQTSARRDFYELYATALRSPQIVTRRAVPAYVFRAATMQEKKQAKLSEMVIVQALVQGTG